MMGRGRRGLEPPAFLSLWRCVFFVSGCKVCQYCSIRSVPLAVIKFLIIFMLVEFPIKKFFQSCSARTGFTPMQTYLLLSELWTIFLIRSLFVTSHSIASTGNTTFCATNANRVSHYLASHNTLFGSLRTRYLHLGVFLRKQYIILASYKYFCKLQSIYLFTPLLTLT